MFTVDNITYDLHFTRDRIKLYESKTGKSAVSELVASNGMLPIASVEAYFSVALVDTNRPGVYVPAKKAIEVADAYMDEAGYAAVCTEIVTAIQKDLGFLFRQG